MYRRSLYLRRCCMCFLCGIGVLLGQAQGNTIPPPDGFVTDQAEVLSVEQEEMLEERALAIDAAGKRQVGILLIDSLATFDTQSIELFSIEVADEQQVGYEDRDNGILILIAVDDRLRRIDVGYGLEGTITDGITRRIGEQTFPPYFVQDDYSGGLLAAINHIDKFINEDASIVAQYTSSNEYGESNSFREIVMNIVINIRLIWVFFSGSILILAPTLFQKGATFLGLTIVYGIIWGLITNMGFDGYYTGFAIAAFLMMIGRLMGMESSGSSGGTFGGSRSGRSSSSRSFGGGSFGGGGASGSR